MGSSMKTMEQRPGGGEGGGTVDQPEAGGGGGQRGRGGEGGGLTGHQPEVGSSMKTMEGLETSSTATVRRRRCSTDSPLKPGKPTRAPRKPCMSTNSNTCASHRSVNMRALMLACCPAATPRAPCCYSQGPAATPRALLLPPGRTAPTLRAPCCYPQGALLLPQSALLLTQGALLQPQGLPCLLTRLTLTWVTFPVVWTVLMIMQQQGNGMMQQHRIKPRVTMAIPNSSLAGSLHESAARGCQ